MDRALQETGVTSTGSISSSGVVNSRLTLSAGQTLTVTAHAIDYLDVIYDASSSSGSLVFKKNGGSAYATKTVSGTGLQSTFPTAALGTIESDTLTITASGGTVVITGILKYKTAVGGNSPKIFIGGWSGTAYQDYTSSASLTELAYYLNFFTSGSDPKTCLFMLGTNNIYSGTKALSPAAMISQIQTVIAGLNARSSTVSYVLSVPPKASGVWPIIVGGYTYQNYVDAIVSFAQANNYGMIRNDIGDLSNSTHYADGVHPDSLGHLVMAQTVCAAFGIPLNDYIKTAQTASETAAAAAAALVAGFFTPIVADITMNSTWRPFGNVTANRGMVMKQSNLVVQISGIVEPNGSVSTVVGTLPAAYRPTRSVFFVCSTNAGPVSAYIDTSGNINLGAVPTTWLSLESVTFHVNRP
jgi:lysophospholipase L1-like esterase